MKGAHTIAPEGYRDQGRLVAIWLTRGVASYSSLPCPCHEGVDDVMQPLCGCS
jgi:hypothetical protein